ncbi:hypothetical protein TVAG_334300 [Trichomonas vaginalis G3]|uniref:Uncharacterized protein n=1 Tax=Trichomonas vaginalis (strain ATCC PRA-98 / G3) TaxID=412133 RepID=A2EID6_TRIV3|nr:hypothetical protein TVAGG3_0887670 [Trichomonas vaginalis G3]EAY07618.1 hypothetical protein TVAG_334300 [Trichomonas vaginalis G3]KAI5502496.1 hypothetical protein TVAGG3_0887670 [Trichomonas vaginalis G3]|eukprot:XP_001319841.1 hypothetical protein [Trichomonas vaginalis G3]
MVAKVLELFDDLRPYALLLDYEKISPDPQFLHGIIDYYAKPKVLMNFYGRYHNEETFYKSISNLLGKTITSNDLVDNSIVKLILPSLLALTVEDSISLGESELLSYPDEDRIADFAVIYTFKALELIVNAIKGQNIDESELLSLISNIPVSYHKQVIIDILSILFLQDSTGKFVCTASLAQQVLTVLETFADEKETKEIVANGLSKLQRGIVMNAHSISECLLSTKDSVLVAFSNYEYDMAEILSKDDKELNEICKMAHAIHLIKNGNQEQIPKEWFTSKLWENLALSWNQNEKSDKKFDQKIFSEKISDEKVLKLIEKRKNEVDIKPVLELALKHVNSNDTSVEFNYNYKLLKGFVDYVDLYNRTTKTELGTQGGSAIDGILQSTKISDLKDLELLLGKNALEFILSSKKVFNASDNIKSLIDGISPLILKTSQFYDAKTQQKQRITKILKSYSSKFSSNKEISDCLNEDFDDLDVFMMTFLATLHSLKNISEEIIYLAVDLLDDVYYFNIPEEFVEKILNISILNNLIQIIIEIRFRYPFIVDKCKETIRKEMHLIDFINVFPEESNSQIETILKSGIEVNDMNSALDQLIDEEKDDIALEIATNNNILDDFVTKMSSKITQKIKENQKFNVHFTNENVSRKIFNSLPEEQRTLTNQLILTHHNAKSSSLLSIINEFPDIECDNEIIHEFNQKICQKSDIEKVQIINKWYDKYYKVMKNKSMIVDYVYDLFKVMIDSVEVNNLENEEKFVKILKKINNFLNNYQLKEEKKIRYFCKLINLRLFLRFGVNYSFKGFPDKTNNIREILMKFDEMNLIFEHKELFKEDNIALPLLKQSLNCCNLGFFDDAMKFLQNCENPDEKSEDFNSIEDLVNEGIRTLKHPIPFELRYLDNPVNVEITPPFYRINVVIMGRGGMLIGQDQFKALAKLIESFTGLNQCLSYHVSLGQFKELFDVWRRLPEILQSEHCAIERILKPAVYSQQIQQLWQYLARNDKDRDDFKTLEGILNYFRINRMLLTLADAQLKLGLFEDAIETLLDAENDHSSWKEWLSKIDLLQAAISREKSVRTGKHAVFKIPSVRFSKIEQLSRLQRQYIEMCINTKIRFNKYHDILTSDSSALQMSLVCLFNQEFTLAVQIADSQNCLQDVVEQLVGKVEYAGIDVIKDILAKMADKMDSNNYAKLATMIMTVLTPKLKKTNIPQFIVTHIKGAELQISLLAKFNFLQEAMQVAKKYGKKEGYLIIESAASATGNHKLASECEKLSRK